MKIKICGLFREEDADYANQALPDYAGFVFVPKSRRFIKPAWAAKLRERLDPKIISVGVFVREKPEEIAALYRNGVIGMVQLHGGEDGAYIAKLRRLCNAPLIRAVDAVKLTLDWGENSLPDFGAEYLLLDNGPGGTGERFDWSLLKVLTEKNSESSPPFSIPFFLAGGIGLHNIKEALSRNPYALDISSGAESEGFKNREKMLRLVQLVRKYGRRRTTEG